MTEAPLDAREQGYAAVDGVEAWWHMGRRVEAADAAGRRHRLFVRVEGTTGPWTTFFHGFPSCSWDWAPLLPHLPHGRRRLLLDHLGFGDSDKPRDHAYSFADQIALAEDVWRAHGVDDTLLVVHDYSVSMAQEILARLREGTWKGPRIRGVLLLNGGLFFSQQRPLLIQRLLHGPLGPLAARLVTRRAFERAFTRIFAPAHAPDAAHLGEQWRSITHRDGLRVYHLLSRYHAERRANEARWSAALAATDVPLRFGWGTLDPVSGAPMLRAIRARVPDAQVDEWPDLGHYPMLEAPVRVASVVASMELATAR